jgi:hypothetical protein
MTNVLIVPLLELLLALFALGLVATLVNLRDFIPKRFRFPIYAGVVVLLVTTAAFVGRAWCSRGSVGRFSRVGRLGAPTRTVAQGNRRAQLEHVR